MFPSEFNNYKIKVKDKPFEAITGEKYSNTASISFLNELNQEITFIELGYISVDEVYQLIAESKALSLNSAFIENFSLSEYRKKYNLPDNETVVLNSFSAISSIFLSNTVNDFKNAVFSKGCANFENALFIKGEVYFDDCMFEDGTVNFNSAIFVNGNVSFYNTNFVKGLINFKNCKFGTGFKNFQYAFWGNDDILFSNTNFGNGNISFVNCSFGNGELSFKICIFGKGNKDFKFAVFGDVNVSFERAEMGEGVADFGKTEFGNSKLNFNKSRWVNAELIFNESQMSEGKMLLKQLYLDNSSIHFDEAVFPKTNISFSRSIFNQTSVSFFKTELNELSFETCQLNNYCDFRLKHCKLLDLSNAFVRDIVDLSYEENPTATKQLNLFGTRLLGRFFISWKANDVFNLILKNNASHYQKAWQYNLLKQNFNTIGQYDDEDFAYVAFKREEMALEYEKTMTFGFIKKMLHRFLYYAKKLIFDRMGLYATSPVRVFYSVVSAWFSFGLIYCLFHFMGWGKTWSSVGNPDNISIVAQSFYHSAITFFTIGYGDVFPEGLSRIVSAIEGFTGVFMMSYFTVAFVRKVLR